MISIESLLRILPGSFVCLCKIDKVSGWIQSYWMAPSPYELGMSTELYRMLSFSEISNRTLNFRQR